jgi:hypothetical protein
MHPTPHKHAFYEHCAGARMMPGGIIGIFASSVRRARHDALVLNAFRHHWNLPRLDASVACEDELFVASRFSVSSQALFQSLILGRTSDKYGASSKIIFARA